MYCLLCLLTRIFYRNDWFKTVDLVNQFGYIPFYNGGNNANRIKHTYQCHDSYYKTMYNDALKITLCGELNWFYKTSQFLYCFKYLCSCKYNPRT